MHLKLECLPDMIGKITLSVLASGNMYSFLDLGNILWKKNHSVLNETAPLPDRTGKQSLLL
jgi:hypothetical protein